MFCQEAQASSRTEEWLGFSCEVVSTPGHTKVDKSFYFPELAILFSGDCLINGACGRILGGTVVEMFKSLRWISTRKYSHLWWT